MSLTNKLTKQELRDYVKSLGFAQYEYDDAIFEIPDNKNSWGSTEWVVEIKDRWLHYVTGFNVAKDENGAYYIDSEWDKDRKIPYKELPKDIVFWGGEDITSDVEKAMK